MHNVCVCVCVEFTRNSKSNHLGAQGTFEAVSPLPTGARDQSVSLRQPCRANRQLDYSSKCRDSCAQFTFRRAARGCFIDGL